MKVKFYDTTIDLPYASTLAEIITDMAKENSEFHRACVDTESRLKSNVIILVDDVPVEARLDENVRSAHSVEFILQLSGG